MAGLACAVTLHRSGVPFLLFERDEKVGGRVQTDKIDGYRLDRGFQVLLTAYPEAKRFLDYEKLELKSCYPGSRVWYDGKFHQVSDPFRHPFDGVYSIFNPIGSFFDKLKVGMLRMGLKSTSRYPDDVPTIEALQDLGFSKPMINRFWEPFMRGVFLENDLSTSVRKFEETFRLFAEGETTSSTFGYRRNSQTNGRTTTCRAVETWTFCFRGTSSGDQNQGRKKLAGKDRGVSHRF